MNAEKPMRAFMDNYDDLTFSDILEQESHELAEFGDEAVAKFISIGDTLMDSLSRGLSGLVSGEFSDFRSGVRGTLAGIGMEVFNPVLKDFGTSIGGSVLGGAFGQLGSTILGNIIGKGDPNIRDAIRRTASSASFSDSVKQGQGQIAAEMQRFIQSGWRNL